MATTLLNIACFWNGRHLNQYFKNHVTNKYILADAVVASSGVYHGPTLVKDFMFIISCLYNRYHYFPLSSLNLIFNVWHLEGSGFNP